ncbi:hypothetical protein GUJ93_ZPchr0014g46550 [Zizania palustris]|uniref:Uncharacterized protein n=1 Tax=Zizania palustris TaxID=103762 RepID=A0A8J5TH13_ZIZPA|nr:hypothetical protein GUJ93_ZPchr0014g46550 [Zizania palustris]
MVMALGGPKASTSKASDAVNRRWVMKMIFDSGLDRYGDEDDSHNAKRWQFYSERTRQFGANTSLHEEMSPQKNKG